MILTTKSKARTTREELQIALPMTRPTIPPDKELSKEINSKKKKACLDSSVFAHLFCSIVKDTFPPFYWYKNVKSCYCSSLAFGIIFVPGEKYCEKGALNLTERQQGLSRG